MIKKHCLKCWVTFILGKISCFQQSSERPTFDNCKFLRSGKIVLFRACLVGKSLEVEKFMFGSLKTPDILADQILDSKDFWVQSSPIGFVNPCKQGFMHRYRIWRRYTLICTKIGQNHHLIIFLIEKILPFLRHIFLCILCKQTQTSTQHDSNPTLLFCLLFW